MKKIVLSILLLLIMFGNAFAQSSQTIALKEGFNFISFTVTPAIGAAALKSQNPSLDEIYTYSAASGSFLSLGEGTLTTLGYGRGYIVRANAQATLTVSGQVPATIANLSLKAGFNLVGLSRKPENITFSQLMIRYNVIRGIYRWSAASGTFIQVLRDNDGNILQLDGIDPAVSEGSSYFFNIFEDTTLSYSGDKIQFGSTPPLPTFETVSLPSFNPASGVYSSQQLVSLSTATAGAAIYYTLDESIPNTNSTLYTGPITVSKSVKIKAIAVKAGLYNSYVANAAYTIESVVPQQVAVPVFTPVPGTYASAQSINISTATSGAAIYFTVDGSQPSQTNGILYTSAINIAQNATIKAIAVKAGMTNSSLSTANYVINQNTTPVVTSVELTIASTIVEGQTAQANVVVRDAAGNQMLTGFTIAYNISAGSSLVSSSGLVTAGTYNSSNASLNTNILSVTVTPLTGNALSKTASFVVASANDTVKPVIASVSSVDNKTILVTFSEKVKDSAAASDGALNPANYMLYSEATGSTITLQAAAAGANQIQAVLVFNDTTNTVVKISINAGDGTSGYPANGLDAKTYRIYVKNVVDIAATPNAIIANSNMSFIGSTAPASSVPKLIAASYNKGTGKITMTFDKPVNNAVTYTKVKFNAVALTAAGTVGGALTSKIEYTVSSNDKTAIAALAGVITMTLEAGAVNDTSSPAIGNELTNIVPGLTVPPMLTSATYDETANRLTLGFDQTINLANSAFLTNSNFRVKSTEMAEFALDATDNLNSVSNTNTIGILLSSTHISAMEGVSAHTSLKVYVKANAVESTNAVGNLQQDDSAGYPAVNATVIKDAVNPAVTSITFNESTKMLVFNFNVAVQASFANASGVSLKSSADDAEKDNLAGLTGIANGTTLQFDLSSPSDPNVTGFVSAIKAIQQGNIIADTPNAYDAYFTIAADTFTKSGSTTLKNLAVSTKNVATTVVYTDNVAPGYAAANAVVITNKAAVTITFNEKVDKISVETAANYKIYNTSTNAQLAVYTAIMSDSMTTKKTVILYTDSQTNGDTYRLDISGVKDIAATPNMIATAIQKTFVGTNATVTVPVISSVTIEDRDGTGTLSDNDQLKVTFNEPVKVNAGSYTDLNNVFLLNGGALSAATVALTKMTFDAVDYKVVYLTYNTANPSWNAVIAGISTLNIKAAQTCIVHKYDVSASASNGSAIAINPPGDKAAISAVTIEDANNNALVDKGDKINIIFNKQVKRAAGTALLAADFSVYLNGAYGAADASPFGTLAASDFTSSITNTAYGTTATLTIGGSGSINVNPTQLGLGVRVSMDAAGRVVDSWGVGNAAYVNGTTDTDKLTYKTITGKNTISAPQVQSVQFVDVDSNGSGSANDYLIYTFNVPVYMNAGIGTVMGQWALGAGTLANNPASAPAYLMDSDHKKVKVILGGNESIFTGVTVSDIKVSHADFATNIKLANFNGSKPSANGSGLVITSDTTSRPAIVSAEFIAVNKLKIKFDRAIVLTATNGNKVVLHNNGAALTDGSGAAMALDATDATNVTLLVTLAAAQDAYVTSGFGADASMTGFGVLADSGIKAASSGLEVVAFGVATTSNDHKRLAADTTAPDMFTDIQIAKVAYDNVNLKVTSSASLTPSEKVRVEVYIGADIPAKVAGTYTAYNAYAFPGASWDAGAANPLIASVVGAAVPGTHKIFYRFKDVAGNISDWKQDGTVAGAPRLR